MENRRSRSVSSPLASDPLANPLSARCFGGVRPHLPTYSQGPRLGRFAEDLGGANWTRRVVFLRLNNGTPPYTDCTGAVHGTDKDAMEEGVCCVSSWRSCESEGWRFVRYK